MSQKPLKANETIANDPLALVRKIAACSHSPLSGEFRRVKDFADYDRVSEKFDPSTYTDALVFRHDYLCHEILRKFSGSTDDESELDLDIPALQSFHDTEAVMAKVNERLNLTSKEVHPYKGVGECAISHARLKLLRLLGPTISMVELKRSCSFSSGASFNLTRRDGSTPAHKFECRTPEVTYQCAPLFDYLISDSVIWQENIEGLVLVPGNRITTVPKNRKTNRTIAIEPLGNMYIQKGIGSMIRSRLKKVGINLNDQTINQEYARLGSIDGVLATVDLSAASDSISTSLCRLLLPPNWYDLIMLTRSERGILPDESSVEYEKVSSMGNGYTFELESLLFWALASSVADKDDTISVYGDDIIIPSRLVPDLQRIFEYVGFSLNMTKSFWTGSFRESCGKHYFSGVDVSPVYHKTNGNKPGRYRTMKHILLANNLRRLIGENYETHYLPVYHYVVRHLSEFWQKPRIPDGVGDGALIGSLDEVLPKFGFAKRIRIGPCFHASVLVKVADEAPGGHFGGYLESLSGDCTEPDPLTSTQENCLQIAKIRNKLGKSWVESRYESHLMLAFKLHDSEFSLRSVRGKVRKSNMRIWKWTDPKY